MSTSHDTTSATVKGKSSTTSRSPCRGTRRERFHAVGGVSHAHGLRRGLERRGKRRGTAPATAPASRPDRRSPPRTRVAPAAAGRDPGLVRRPGSCGSNGSRVFSRGESGRSASRGDRPGGTSAAGRRATSLRPVPAFGCEASEGPSMSRAYERDEELLDLRAAARRHADLRPEDGPAGSRGSMRISPPDFHDVLEQARGPDEVHRRRGRGRRRCRCRPRRCPGPPSAGRRQIPVCLPRLERSAARRCAGATVRLERRHGSPASTYFAFAALVVADGAGDTRRQVPADGVEVGPVRRCRSRRSACPSGRTLPESGRRRALPASSKSAPSTLR